MDTPIVSPPKISSGLRPTLSTMSTTTIVHNRFTMHATAIPRYAPSM